MVKERDVLLQETKQMMEEQQKKHKAVQKLLQKKIEMLKVAISGQPCNVSNSPHIPNISHMCEKASTNTPSKFTEVATSKEVCEDGCDDVVEQTEVEANKGKDCKLAFSSKDNIVASGTIVDINVPQQLLHNVPLGKENIRVSVNYAINGASPLPIPVKGVLNTVEDDIGSQVAWPEDLIVFIDDVVKLMSQGQTLASYIDEDIFGVEKMIYVLKEDVISFIQMNEIGQAIITAYISRIFHDLKSPDEAGRVQYIVIAFNQASIDSIFLFPYNPGGHWILTIIDEEKDNVYIMDPLGACHPHEVWKRIGAPKQANGKTCGYCVMWYMKEICEDSTLAFRTKYARSGKKKAFYTQMELDEV
ncbi:unnamed protein product [Prunus armeniaca]|uniref:Ubiquitin-like protease family profile domain-containing protein n=1 Tax=Prunus armeniaca TaxID=36596 RepID=A0A6J5V3Y2_PRUAR|nr:unnamed protein product [Prunus armeniaca]